MMKQANDFGGGFYDDPVVYDILAAPGTQDELDVLESVVEEWAAPVGGPRLWLEPACGTGRCLRGWAARGRRAVGFDVSGTMVADARRRLRRRGLADFAEARVADMADCGGLLPPGTVDVAYLPDNSFRHLPDDAAALAHLDGMAKLLRPGGVYVVGISLTNPEGEEPDEDVWTASRGGIRVTRVVNYLPPETGAPGPRLERVISHLVVQRSGREEHRDHVYDLRTYTPRQWEELLAGSGLRRLASLDRLGMPRAGRDLLYQLEVLARRA
ncbi:MAG: class I SAM-dependent methyltransferase [Candidatus Latescibacteria bacterium]|nr:class I SAM-dependent methyltransferase [Candidatus Latescibacterota bacterium]